MWIFVRILIALGLWIAAITAIFHCIISELDYWYIGGALVAWLLAFWIWPRQHQQQRQQSRKTQDWFGSILDLLELVFYVIELPIRLVFWLFRRLGDIAHALD